MPPVSNSYAKTDWGGAKGYGGYSYNDGGAGGKKGGKAYGGGKKGGGKKGYTYSGSGYHGNSAAAADLSGLSAAQRRLFEEWS